MLSNKITGAAQGIGRSLAFVAAREGAKLFLTDFNATGLAETVKLVNAQYPKTEVASMQMDVSKEPDNKKMVEEVLSKFGHLDVAINNAGVINKVAYLPDQTLDELHRVFSVNVDGVFLAMKYEIPAMKANKKGSIVNISSIAAVTSSPGHSIYCASKHAVAALSKSASTEVAKDNIRVNCVNPETQMGHELGAPISEMAKIHPMGRCATPEEVAEMAVFIASDKASFTTGTHNFVNGGLSDL